MKKFLLLVLAVTMTLLTACGNTPQANTETTTDTPKISFEEEDLILAYCNGTWDGSLILSNEHCASIEDGVLWIDCQSTYRVPDMGPYEDSLWIEVLETSDEGTWTYHSDIGLVEHWSKGFRKEMFEIDTNAYYTSFYKMEDCIVARYGSSLQVYNLLGGKEYFCLEDVVDVYQDDTGVLCSTFEHKNYRIRGAEDVEDLETSYVRFPRPEGNLVHSDEIILTQAFNLFYGEGWDGKCRRLDDGQFIAVDYYGNIVVNNELIGNVCLGDSVVASDGPNIYLDKDRSYYLDGTQLVYFEHGPIDRKIDVPDGTAKFLWVQETDSTTTIAAQSGNTMYVIYIDRDDDVTIKVISENVVDASVAYDTLYYMVGDVVYSLNWLNPEATPQPFFEGAYAVSHHTDEAEGALVPQEKANYQAYGYSNIYSPYGRHD